MGRSKSIKKANFSNARIGRQAIYVPEYYVNNGTKRIQAKLSFPAICNDIKGNGGEGRAHTFRFVAWGGYADAIATCASIGQALDLDCTVESYLGKLYDQNDNIMTRPDGSPVLIEKVTFKIDDLTFGEESAKYIAEQIQMGKRPVGWDRAGSPEAVAFGELMRARRAHKWVKGDTLYGFARVVVPKGEGIILAVDMPTATMVSQPAGNMESAVAQVANAMPAPTTPPATAPAQSAGQNLF